MVGFCFFFFENRHQSTIIELKQKTSTHLSRPLQLQVVEAKLGSFPVLLAELPGKQALKQLCHTCQANPGHALCETQSQVIFRVLLYLFI